MTNTVLTFVLGVLAVAGVIFALQTIFLTRSFRQLTVQAAGENAFMMQAQGPSQALLNDVITYNKSTPSPELTKLLQSIQAKPAAK